MRSSFWIAVLIGALILSTRGDSHAQVKVEVVPDQDQFIQDENLTLEVRIKNISGRPLGLGADPGWLNFHVESLDGFLLEKRPGLMPIRRQLVESSAIVTQRVDIVHLYDLTRAGRYRVTAHLQVPGFEKDFSSEPVKFDVSRGVSIWQEDFGVPSSGAVPEIRRYSLLRANFLNRTALYVRVAAPDDAEVFGVTHLGKLVSFSSPEQMIDRLSRLHVLFQDGARSFSYNVIDPDGRLVVRQTHLYYNSRPQLRSRDGEVAVAGGARRAEKSDIPVMVEQPVVPPPAPVPVPAPSPDQP